MTRLAKGHAEAFVEALPDPVLEFAPMPPPERGWRVAWANPAAGEVLGWEPSELVGVSLQDVIPGLEVGIGQWCESVLGTGQPLLIDDVSAPTLLPPGRRWVDARAVKVQDRVAITWRDVTDRHQTAEALERSEARARLVADHANDVTFAGDISGVLTWVSDSIIRMLGRDPASLVGHLPIETVHQQDWAVANAAHQGLAQGVAQSFQVRVSHADGSWRWVAATMTPVRDDTGTVTGAVGGWRDITEEVRTRQALADSEARYRLLIENITDVVFRLDRDGVIEWAGGPVEGLLGYPVGEVVGRVPSAFVAPEHASTAERFEHDLLRDGRALARLRFVAADGSRRWIEWTGSLIREETGASTGMVGGWRDVTEQETQRQALADSEARYRLLADNSSDVIILTDYHFKVLWASPSVQTVLGLDPEDLLGHRALERVHPEDRPGIAGQVEESDHSGSPTRMRFRWRRGNRAYLWVEAHGRTVPDTGAGLPGRVVQVRDVDAQVRSQAQIETMARTDAMTGLLNRAEALRRLDAALSQTPRVGHRVAVLYLDLDALKSVNDTHGHLAGDLLLTQTAEHLRDGIREDDQCARIGGDEFLVILAGVHGHDDAVEVANSLRNAIAEPVRIGPGRRNVTSTVSVGVTLARIDDTVDTLIARADAAMYMAKKAGGNVVCTT